MTTETDYVESSVMALVMNPNYIAEVFSAVNPEDFSTQTRGAFEIAHTLFSEGQPVDAVTVAERLEADGSHNAMGFIHSILDSAGHVSIENLAYYTKIISSRSLHRKIQRALVESRDILTDESPESAYEQIVQRLSDINQEKKTELWDMKSAAKVFLQDMQDRVDANGELIGVSTGFRHLDNRLGGMRPGDMIVVAGRPGMGKSTLALNMLEYNAARKKKPCLLFTMEMGVSQVIEKMTASLGEIDLGALRRGTLNGEEWAKFTAANTMIQNAPLWIDERGGLTVAQIRAKCFEVKRRQGLDLIVIDYLGLMTSKGNNRNEEITKISSGIKQLAKDLKCPVVALSQLNRGVESRPDKRPQMSDLRESGSVEQDADAVIFPYRPGYYDRDNPNPSVLCEIIMAKLRMGETGSEGLRWEGKFSRFAPVTERPDFEQMRQEKDREVAEANRKPRKSMMV